MSDALPKFDTLWDYSAPAATETKFRDLLAQQELSAPPEYLAELLTQIARCQGLQDNFDAGHLTLDRAASLLSPAMHRAYVRLFLERGRLFNSAGNPATAIPFFHDAWTRGTASNETRLALDALHMLAIAQPTPALRIEWNLKGLAAVREDPTQNGWFPAFYNNLGEAYLAAGDFQSALEAFQNLDAFERATGRPSDIHTLKDIAKMLRLLGRTTEALASIQPVHNQLTEQNTSDGWIDEELAECLLARGNSAAAKPLFQRAYQALQSDLWVQRNAPAKLIRLAALAAPDTPVPTVT